MRKFAVAPFLIMAMLAIPGVSGAAPSPSAGRPDAYIVVLKDGVDPAQAAEEHARRLGAEVGHTSTGPP